jgi:hypothetical protein
MHTVPLAECDTLSRPSRYPIPHFEPLERPSCACKIVQFQVILWLIMIHRPPGPARAGFSDSVQESYARNLEILSESDAQSWKCCRSCTT